MGPPGLTFERLRSVVEEKIPFNRLLGLKLDPSSAVGDLLVCMPANAELVGDTQRPALHGGSLAALIDTTAGFCAWTQLERSTSRLSTVDLRVDFLAPAPVAADVFCRAAIIRAGRRLIFVDATVFPAGCEDKPVAVGRGTFSVKE